MQVHAICVEHHRKQTFSQFLIPKNKHHLLGETEQFLNRKTSFGLEFDLFIQDSFQDFTVNLSQPTSTFKRILVYWIGLYTGWSILPPLDNEWYRYWNPWNHVEEKIIFILFLSHSFWFSLLINCFSRALSLHAIKGWIELPGIQVTKEDVHVQWHDNLNKNREMMCWCIFFSWNLSCIGLGKSNPIIS